MTDRPTVCLCYLQYLKIRARLTTADAAKTLSASGSGTAIDYASVNTALQETDFAAVVSTNVNSIN